MLKQLKQIVGWPSDSIQWIGAAPRPLISVVYAVTESIHTHKETS